MTIYIRLAGVVMVLKKELSTRSNYLSPLTVPDPKYATDKTINNRNFTCLKGQSLNNEGVANERSSRTDTSFSDLLKELRKLHRIGLARESFLSSLPSYTIFEQAIGGCLGTVSAGITGFRHLGGTEDTNTVLSATKARMFRDVTNARCSGSARNWKAWVHQILITARHYYKATLH